MLLSPHAQVGDAGSEHFSDPHHNYGLAACIFVFLQPLNAFLRPVCPLALAQVLSKSPAERPCFTTDSNQCCQFVGRNSISPMTNRGEINTVQDWLSDLGTLGTSESSSSCSTSTRLHVLSAHRTTNVTRP